MMDKELIERFVNSTTAEFFGNNTVDLNMPDTVNLPYLKSTITPAAIGWPIQSTEDIKEHVNHPSHYGGEDNVYEAIKVIEAWDLGFCLGNAIKYISRAGKKDHNSYLQDLKKAKWYLDREITKFEV